jgi:hypothetical protein
MVIPDYIIQNAAWVAIATGGVALGTYQWKRWKGAIRMKRISQENPGWNERRRSDDSMWIKYMDRQDMMLTRFLDSHENNTKALMGMMTALKAHTERVEDQLKNCRDGCGALHRRIDEHLQGHIAA